MQPSLLAHEPHIVRWSTGDDFVLHRFLRARQFDVAHAREMYLQMMAWRAEHAVDDICDGIGESSNDGGPPGDGRVFAEDEQARWDQVYRQGYHGVDKGGRPIYIERIGGISYTCIVGVTTPERLYKKTIRSYEYLWRSLIPRSSKMCNEARQLKRRQKHANRDGDATVKSNTEGHTTDEDDNDPDDGPDDDTDMLLTLLSLAYPGR